MKEQPIWFERYNDTSQAFEDFFSIKLLPGPWRNLFKYLITPNVFDDSHEINEAITDLLNNLLYDLKFELQEELLNKARSRKYYFYLGDIDIIQKEFLKFIQRRADYNDREWINIDFGKLLPAFSRRINKNSAAFYYQYLYHAIKNGAYISTLPANRKLISRLNPKNIKGIKDPRIRHENRLTEEIMEISNFISCLGLENSIFDRNYCLYLHGRYSYVLDILLLLKAQDELNVSKIYDFIDDGYYVVSQLNYPCARYYLLKHLVKIGMRVGDLEQREYCGVPGGYIFVQSVFNNAIIPKLKKNILETITPNGFNDPHESIWKIQLLLQRNPLDGIYRDLLKAVEQLNRGKKETLNDYFQLRKVISKIVDKPKP